MKDWIQAVGREYLTRDRRRVLIVAHVVRVQSIDTTAALAIAPPSYNGYHQDAPVTEIHAITNDGARLTYDQDGNFQRGTWANQVEPRVRMGKEDPLDLAELVGGAK